MDESFVTVFRGYDPIQTEILGDLLRDGGVEARVSGTRHGALVGVAQNILEVSIRVPQSQAAQAADFLEAYFDADGEDLLAQEFGDDEEPEDEEPGPRPADRQSPLFAAGSMLLLFGGSHIYCGRYATAAAIGCAQIWAMRSMMTETWVALASGFVTFATLLLLDMLAGQVAVWQNRRGVRVPVWRQLALGGALAALGIAVGSVVGPQIPQPEDNEQSRISVSDPILES